MWLTRILIAACLGLSFQAMAPTQNELSFDFRDEYKITFKELPADIDEEEAADVAQLLYDYFDAIETNNYDKWFSQLSEQTKNRIEPPKFPRKFHRLVGLHLQEWSQKEVVGFKKVDWPGAQEKGDTYAVMIKLPEGRKFTNRVGFDPLVSLDMENEEDLFGMQITQLEDGKFKVLIFKLERKGQNQNSNTGNDRG